jgi:hypothetical protein
MDLLAEALQYLIDIPFPPRSHHQLHNCFMGIFGPHHCHAFVGFDDEFEIGDILSTEPEIS